MRRSAQFTCWYFLALAITGRAEHPAAPIDSLTVHLMHQYALELAEALRWDMLVFGYADLQVRIPVSVLYGDGI